MTQTPTKAEELAARLESGWCPIESPADMERAAAELRRLAAVEAERDDLKLALAHTVRLVQDWKQSAYSMEAERYAMRLNYSRLLEKHNNLHANAARDRAERDALREAIAAHDAEQAQEAQQPAGRASVDDWERELSAVMPADFKDWWQNSRREWPAVAAEVIKSLRLDRDAGWEVAAMAQRREPLTDEQIAEGRYRTWAAPATPSPAPDCED